MELWEPDDLDLLGSARFTLEQGGRGHMMFIAVDVLLDYQFAGRDGVEFTFEGSDEGDRVSGHGWALLEGQTLRRSDRLSSRRQLWIRCAATHESTTHSSRTTTMKASNLLDLNGGWPATGPPF